MNLEDTMADLADPALAAAKEATPGDNSAAQDGDNNKFQKAISAWRSMGSMELLFAAADVL